MIKDTKQFLYKEYKPPIFLMQYSYFIRNILEKQWLKGSKEVHKKNPKKSTGNTKRKQKP